jgi:hypothetical protein
VPRSSFTDFRDLSALSGTGLRSALLRELTDLYVQKPSHTPEEERLFTELALRLIDHVDAAERARLGARLAAYPGAPLAVIQRLAEPAPALNVRFSPPAEAEIKHLPRLEDSPREQTLSDTFFNALPAERRLILLHLEYAPVAPAAIATPAGTVAQLEQAAMSRQRDQFAATIETMLSVSSRCARRIAGDSTGEAVIAALKALSLPSPALQRILLFLDPAIGQSAQTYFALVQLYDEIGVDSARRLVAIWRKDDAPSSEIGRHHTQLFDDRPSRARDFARHNARSMTAKPVTEGTRRLDQSES